MARPARVSPDAILAAAALEFAARGFAGARVDRIARRAKVNKAMIYYHFKSKQRLYRALLRRMFTLAAARLQAIAIGPGAPADKVDRAIAGIAAFIQEHTFFPAIMLREVAEGGAHLDRETLRALAAVPRAVAGIVAEGVTVGDFRPVDPVFAYFSMLAPIVFYLAGTPIRRELSHLHVIEMRAMSPAEFVEQVQESARRSLRHDAQPTVRPRA
jgi:TetR/AcrR family transcriptional regulator